MPLDEIGIFLFARMMHRHVTVCFNDLWWSTHSDDNSTNVDCILVYHGKCIYVPTVVMSVEEYLSKKPYLENVRKAWNDNFTMSENGSTMPKVEHSTVADEQEVSNCTLQDNDVPNRQAIGTCTVSKTEDKSTMQDNVIGTATLMQDDEMLQDIQESFDVKPRKKTETFQMWQEAQEEKRKTETN